MKRLLLPLCLLFSGFIFSQNITWQNVTLNVPNENAQAVFNLIDGFYSNVEIPEGVRVSLWNIQFKGPSEKATHVLNLAGPTDALVEFESRKLTPEWDAYISQLNSLTDPNGFSVTAGTTLVRYNLDKLRKLADIQTICMHGSPYSKFDNKKLWEKYKSPNL